MSPWLKNLSVFAEPTNASFDHSGAKLRDCIRLLIELTIADPQVRFLSTYRRIQFGSLTYTDVAAHDIAESHLDRNLEAR